MASADIPRLDNANPASPIFQFAILESMYLFAPALEPSRRQGAKIAKVWSFLAPRRARFTNLAIPCPTQSPRPQAASSDVAAGRIASPELEIKDAPLIFGQVWNRLVQERGLENMVFPKEIMWLGGAPGSGKGTNTPFILRERGLTAAPIVVSDLLDTPEMRALKDRGQFVGDREVIEALLRKLLEPAYQTGVVVDGFPRTKVQAEAVKLLHDQIMQLRALYWGTPTGKRFRRPIFRITVLFVGEQTSVERQLSRGREIRAHNEKVRRTGVGEPRWSCAPPTSTRLWRATATGRSRS